MLPGEDFEVSVVYSSTFDEVEIIYADDAVKRRVVISGEAFRESMLGTGADGGLGTVVQGPDGIEYLPNYGFDGSSDLMDQIKYFA